jgi:hypothetical protein
MVALVFGNPSWSGFFVTPVQGASGDGKIPWIPEMTEASVKKIYVEKTLG